MYRLHLRKCETQTESPFGFGTAPRRAPAGPNAAASPPTRGWMDPSRDFRERAAKTSNAIAEPLRTMPAIGSVVNRSTGDRSLPWSRSATGQRGEGIGRRAQVVGIRLRVQRLQRLRVHPGRALRKETESDQGPGVAASPVRRPGPRACHQPVPQWARRRVDDDARGVSEDSAGRRRPSAWVPHLRRVKKICRERLYPVTPRKAVKPSRRCAGHAPQGAGELPGYGSHGVGVVSEIDGKDQGIRNRFRPAHTPECRFERVQHVTGRGYGVALLRPPRTCCHLGDAGVAVPLSGPQHRLLRMSGYRLHQHLSE